MSDYTCEYDADGRVIAMMADTHPRARTTDPDTSHQAAASMADCAESQRDRIHAFLVERGPATADKLDAALGLRATSAGRRLPELREMGRAHMTEQIAMTRSGRRARLWAAGKEPKGMKDRDKERLEELDDLDHLGGIDVPYITLGARRLIQNGWANATMHDRGARLKITQAGREAVRGKEDQTDE